MGLQIDHDRVNELLTGFVDGSLDPSSAGELEDHLVECDACRSWVATYRLVSEALQEPDASPVEHLGSHELSAFALTPDLLDGVTRLRCEQHLENCVQCRREQTLAREAATTAARTAWIGSVVSSSGFRRRLALAASLLLLLGVLAYARGSHAPLEYSLLGENLEGVRTVEARRSIVIGASEVHSGASVTFSSGESVALGNGFSVAADARLSIVLDAGDDAGRESS